MPVCPSGRLTPSPSNEAGRILGLQIDGAAAAHDAGLAAPRYRHCQIGRAPTSKRGLCRCTGGCTLMRSSRTGTGVSRQRFRAAAIRVCT
jgi:hypothetical protein